jgi:hypothetical protein
MNPHAYTYKRGPDGLFISIADANAGEGYNFSRHPLMPKTDAPYEQLPVTLFLSGRWKFYLMNKAVYEVGRGFGLAAATNADKGKSDRLRPSPTVYYECLEAGRQVCITPQQNIYDLKRCLYDLNAGETFEIPPLGKDQYVYVGDGALLIKDKLIGQDGMIKITPQDALIATVQQDGMFAHIYMIQGELKE